MKISTTLGLLLILLSTSLVHAQQNQLFEQVNNLVQNSRYTDAIAMLDEILKKEPKNHQALFIKGNSLIYMGKFKEAADVLEIAVAAKPDFFEAYELLGDIYAQFRNPKSAVENYEKAYKHDQSLESKLRYKIEIVAILMLVNQYQFILPHIEDAKKLAPDNFDLKFLEAQYYNYIGDFASAKKLLDVIIKDVPVVEGNEQYFFEIGTTYFNMGQFDKAKNYFANANGGEYRVRLREFTAEHYAEMSEVYFSVNHFAEAERLMEIAVNIEPTHTKALDLKTRIAKVKTKKEELMKAAYDIIASLEKEGKKPADKYYELAVLQYHSNDFQGANLNLDKVLAEKDMDPQAMYLKACCEYQLGISGKGAQFLGRAVKNPSLKPESKAQLFFVLGLVEKGVGNLKEAEEDFKNALVANYKGAAAAELNNIAKSQQLQLAAAE